MIKGRRIAIRVSEKDYTIISRKAALLDVTVSEYLRVSALNRVVKGFKAADADQDEPMPGQLEIINTDMKTVETGKKQHREEVK